MVGICEVPAMSQAWIVGSIHVIVHSRPGHGPGVQNPGLASPHRVSSNPRTVCVTLPVPRPPPRSTAWESALYAVTAVTAGGILAGPSPSVPWSRSASENPASSHPRPGHANGTQPAGRR